MEEWKNERRKKERMEASSFYINSFRGLKSWRRVREAKTPMTDTWMELVEYLEASVSFTWALSSKHFNSRISQPPNHSLLSFSPRAGCRKCPPSVVPRYLPVSAFLLHEQRPWLKYGARRVITSVHKTTDSEDLAGQTQRMIQVHWNSSGSRRTRSRSGWIPRRTL